MNNSSDIVSPEKRSEMMSKIGSKDTKPERIVRSLLHKMGYRFRLHVKNLPGSPDIVLRKYNTVIFVNGCFWHQHSGCSAGRLPKSRPNFWKPKLRKNVERDRINQERLSELGWNVIVVWECETKEKNLSKLKAKLEAISIER